MKENRIITIIFIICLLIRISLVITHIKHDCTHNDDCPICAIIKTLNKDLSIYNPIVTKVILLLILFQLFGLILIRIVKDKKSETLIGLKVELIN